MKAIVENREVALEKRDGHWMPEENTECEIISLSENKVFILVNGKTFSAVLTQVNKEEKTVELILNGVKSTVKIKEPLDELLHSMGLDKPVSKKVANIKAPMPGLVLDIAVEPGANVQKGQKVAVLEAMKMENSIKAAGDGIVARILVQKGQTVDKDQILIEFT